MSEFRAVTDSSDYKFRKQNSSFVLSLALSTVMYVIATSDKIFVMFINALKCQFSFFSNAQQWRAFSYGWAVSSRRIKQLGPVSLSTPCYCMQGSSQKVKWKQTGLLLEVISHSRCLLCRKVESLCKNSLCHPQPQSERLLRRDGPQAFRAQVFDYFYSACLPHAALMPLLKFLSDR